MATRRPLVVVTGTPSAIPAGDKIPTDIIPDNIVLPGTAGFTMPVGTTAQRPADGAGQTRFNSSTGRFEGFVTGKGWVTLDNVMVASYHGSVGQSSGTVRIPFDTTSPLVTEGTQLWSKTVTPLFVGSTMEIEFGCTVDNSNNASAVTMTFYRDNTLIGFACSASPALTNLRPSSLRLMVNDITTSLTPVVYSCRIGSENSGTWYVNRGASATMGGVNNTGWRINEVLGS